MWASNPGLLPDCRQPNDVLVVEDCNRVVTVALRPAEFIGAVCKQLHCELASTIIAFDGTPSEPLSNLWHFVPVYPPIWGWDAFLRPVPVGGGCFLCDCYSSSAPFRLERIGSADTYLIVSAEPLFCFLCRCCYGSVTSVTTTSKEESFATVGFEVYVIHLFSPLGFLRKKPAKAYAFAGG